MHVAKLKLTTQKCTGFNLCAFSIAHKLDPHKNKNWLYGKKYISSGGERERERERERDTKTERRCGKEDRRREKRKKKTDMVANTQSVTKGIHYHYHGLGGGHKQMYTANLYCIPLPKCKI